MTTFDLEMHGDENSPDLFECFDDLPSELQEIIAYYDRDGESSLCYPDCEAFLESVQSLGYTFDYGLDGIPFGLRKM